MPNEHALVASSTLTLTLSILGSSVLPIPYCFSRTGVLPGVALALFVATANALTARLLVRAAHLLKHDSYEALAHAIAGRPGRIVTQCSLILLLFGSFTGACTLLADIGSVALSTLGVPGCEWLAAHGGRGIMLLLVAFVCLPLSLLQHLRALDRAAAVGLFPLAVLLITMGVDAAATGFPALRSGQLPLVRFEVGDMAEATALLGYAFYMQPMLMPLLHDLPHGGGVGARVLQRAVNISVMGVAMTVYTAAGILGASRYGMAIRGDCLLNEWLPGRWGGLLSLSMAVYLAVSAVPVQIALRYTLEDVVAGTEDPPNDFSRVRHVLCTCLPMAASVAVAATYPTYAEKIFAATGALPVCLICYVVPVWLHIVLRKRRAQGEGLLQPLVADDAVEDNQGIVVPLLMAGAMVGISAVAFWTAIHAFWTPSYEDGSWAPSILTLVV